jgi:putative membrane protein
MDVLRRFDQLARERVNMAVRQAEEKTAAEILPIIARSSGDYDRAEDLVGVWVGGILACLAWWFFQGLETDVGWAGEARVAIGFWVFALLFLVGFIAGIVAAHRLAWLRGLFVSPREKDRQTFIRAKTVFFDRRVYRTTRGTGLLLYVTLFERRVAVLADDAIADKMSERALGEVRDAILAGVREGDLARGLCDGIERLGLLLGATLPSEPGRTDEVPSEVVVLDA